MEVMLLGAAITEHGLAHERRQDEKMLRAGGTKNDGVRAAQKGGLGYGNTNPRPRYRQGSH